MSRDTKNNTINRSSSRNKHTTDSESRGATALEGDTTPKLSATKVKILRQLVKNKREREQKK